MMSKFLDKVASRQRAVGRFCGGVDPVLEKIAPTGLSVVKYCIDAVEASVPYLGLVKPNIAFFEARGPRGLDEYQQVLEGTNRADPDLPVIGDWKRGDIGPSNAAYHQALSYYQLPDPQRWLIDAMTASPLFGRETWQPFLDDPEQGLIILCRTSNPGAVEFQNLIVQVPDEPILGNWHVPFYQLVARNVYRDWHADGLVVGATAPKEIADVRLIAPDIFLLVPGVGSQGGDRQQAVAAAFSLTAVADFAINSSGSWLFAWEKGEFACDPKDFAKAAAAYAKDLNRKINKDREALLNRAS